MDTLKQQFVDATQKDPQSILRDGFTLVTEANDQVTTTGEGSEDMERNTRSVPFPVAIVGMGMRLPGGVNGGEQFWDFLVNKRDGLCKVPDLRYNVDAFYTEQNPGTVRTKRGYFLQQDIGCVDAPFFSMSKYEAAKLDPQQRLLLEVIWETMENAGQTNWRGKEIGCYVGVFGEDWLDLMSKDVETHDRYHAMSTGDFAIANRVSYEYDLGGPSMTLRTGCSSSLVGLHEACQALYSGDCISALVAGTNLIITPTMTTAMSDNMVLAPDGVCKTFDAEANGYGRGEAVNAIYIKPLAEALKDGDPIRAVIRSTAVNCDGKTPSITTPGSKAQERLIRRAYQKACIDNILDTAFFECHGTGTVVGDTAETSVVANIFKERGIFIGAVKPNVGHSEGASGITSVIKAVLALERKTIPPNVHFSKPNPNIPFEEAKLKVPVEATPWPEDRRERISVNSFGIGGTNAHVILDSAASFGRGQFPIDRMENGSHLPAPERSLCQEQQPSQSHLLVLSAKSNKSLEGNIEGLKDYIQRKPLLADLAYTLGARREHLTHRAFATVDGNGNLSPFETLRGVSPSVSFVFTGQGAQWPGMGRELLLQVPQFRDDIRSMDETLRGLGNGPSWSIEDELLKGEETSRVRDPELAQPLCTAIQIALVNLLRTWGVMPASVVGHSSGEIAAAYASGAISAHAAIVNSYLRGQAMSALPDGLSGTMAAIGLGEEEVKQYLKNGATVACVNSPQSVTISGDAETLAEILDQIQKSNDDIFCRRLKVNVAYHSAHMTQPGLSYEKLLDAHTSHNQSMTPFYSTTSGEIIRDPSHFSSSYWRTNLQSPVLFNNAVQKILEDTSASTLFVEIGPHSTLAGPLRQIISSKNDEGSSEALYAPTLTRNEDQYRCLLASAGRLFGHGALSDLSTVLPHGNVLTDLPPYKWQHEERHWSEPRVANEWRLRQAPHHELLGARSLDSSGIEPSWRNILQVEHVPWLMDHRIQGDIVFPGAGYIAMAGEAVSQLTGCGDYSVRNLFMRMALVIGESDHVEIVTNLRPAKLADNVDSVWYDFTISAHQGGSWRKHCVGQVRGGQDKVHEMQSPQQYSRPVDPKQWYPALQQRGLEYGPRFQGLKNITASPTQPRAAATIEDKEGLSCSRYAVHPISIDESLQLLSVAATQGIARRMTRLCIPIAIESIYIKESHGPMSLDVLCQMVSGNMSGNATLTSENQVVLSIEKGFFFSVSEDAIRGNNVPLMTTLNWKPHIDLMPAEDQLALIPPGLFDAQQLAFATGLVISETYHRTRDVKPVSEHLQKYLHMIESQYEKIQNDSPDLVPGMELAKDYPDSTSRMAEIERQYAESLQGTPLAVNNGKITFRLLGSIVDILEGRVQPLEVLMADDVLSLVYENLSQTSDWDKFLTLLSHSQPSMRVLEIGGGTGGATSLALKTLGARPMGRGFSTYTFTDISRAFIPDAKEKFKSFGGMEYSILDVTLDPCEQGFEPNSYDLIIAANVIHATPSISQALTHIRKLLVPGGRLLLQELTANLPNVDYFMGVLPGWWLGAEDDRKDKPYISTERWHRELINADFTGVDVLRHDNEVPSQCVTTMISQAAPVSVSSGIVALLYHCQITPWARMLEAALIGDGYTVQWFPLHSPPPPKTDIISVIDLEGPFFDNISADNFAAFKKYLSDVAESNLLWVTQSIQMQSYDPRFALALGLFRTIRQETSHSVATLEIDDFNESAALSAKNVFQHLQRQRQSSEKDADTEFCLSDGAIHICRFEWAPLDGKQLVSQNSATSSRALDVGTYGMLDTLRWVDTVLPALGEKDVEVDISYVGVNFRDMLVALGVLGDHSEIGFEASGIIRRVGSSVKGFQVGDRIMVMGLGLCATRVVLPAERCRHVPDDASLEDAATIGCVYATVIHALINMGNLQPEDSVLIQSACGGVGLAAIQICKVIGAEIYATVGNEEKRQYLIETMGIAEDHIFDSRSSSFLQGILNKTDGRGVDMVLNSLSGELLHASWKCVAPFGKMLELGKRDFLGHGKLDMDIFQENRAFFGIDLHHMSQCDGKAMQRIYKQFDGRFKGHLTPIRPVNVFDAVNITAAYRHMQSGKHMGKIVIKMPEDPSQLPVSSMRTGDVFQPDVAYLLVGGLGGIGRAIATWMAEKGARNFVFLSRSGDKTDAAKTLLADLGAMNCQATVVEGSVAKLEDVQKAVRASKERIAGVIQLSMVLRDIHIANMTHEDWSDVLAPKVQGTWNLHSALSDTDLDFFVLFSSVNGLMGNGGQANYSAANAFLDSFVKYRNARGLAASVIDVGVMEGIGFVSESAPQTLERAKRMCIRTVTETHLLQALEISILSRAHGGPTQLSVGLETTQPLTDLVTPALWSKDIRLGFWKNIMTEEESQPGSEQSRLRDFISSIDRNPQLLNDPETERRITREIGLKIASQMSAGDDMTDEALAGIKIDSLMTIEIRSWFRRHIGIDVSLGDIASSETVGGLGKMTIRLLRSKYLLGESLEDHIKAPLTEEEENQLMIQDMELGKDICPISAPVVEWTSPSEGRVFLTGATGYIGSLCLVMLAGLPSVQEVVCLVRAKDADHGMGRLKEAVGKHGESIDFETKVTVIPGDLSHPTFKQSQEQFDQLAERSSVVFHLGSLVNYILPYSDHREPNVVGLTHVLNFANTKRLKAVHYSSSINVWGPSGLLAGKMIPENEQPPLDMEYIKQHVGHTQSKFAAETVAWNAINNGFPVTIYRPGIVSGHSVTGVGNPNDLFTRMMSNVLRMGSYADPPVQRIQSVPIDFVCSVIVAIAASNPNLPQAFNVVQADQDRTIMAVEFFKIVNQFRQPPLECLPAEEWITKFAESQGHDETATAPLLRERLRIGQVWWGDQGESTAHYDTANLKKALSDRPDLINFKSFSDCLQTYFNHWQNSLSSS